VHGSGRAFAGRLKPVVEISYRHAMLDFGRSDANKAAGCQSGERTIHTAEDPQGLDDLFEDARGANLPPCDRALRLPALEIGSRRQRSLSCRLITLLWRTSSGIHDRGAQRGTCFHSPPLYSTRVKNKSWLFFFIDVRPQGAAATRVREVVTLKFGFR
jgi:hypothetical protein